MNTFLDTLKSLGPVRLAAMGAVAAGIIAFFIYMTTQLVGEEMALLYSDLESRDSGEIVSELEQRNIPYSVSADGSQIRVPESQVGRLRVQMAEQGLPSGGSIGYEIFDESSGLGTTNFVQNVNHVRALEGELARTIRSIDNVQQARVHLVLPQRELFSRARNDPSASIVLLMRGNQRLNTNQVLAVQHLVASAVQNMRPNLVSIVDQQGTLLARGGDENNMMGGASNAQEMRANLEQRLARTLEQLLERSVGPGNVRAEVAAEMNFDRITENEELYDPNSQVARSEQFVDEVESDVDSEGPQPVTVGNNLPDIDADGDGEGRTRQRDRERSEEIINYEISRTVRTHVREGGGVERLSVALLVNGNYITNADGERVYQERSQQEMEQIAALARSAVGFSDRRGDTLEVINLQFVDPTADLEPASRTGLLGLPQSELMRAAELIVLGIVAVLILLLVVRPLMTRLLESQMGQAAGMGGDPALAYQGGGHAQLSGPPGVPATANAPSGDIQEFGMEEEPENEQLIDLNKVEGRVKASSVRKIGEIVDKHPEEAVSIIRTWLYQQQS